MKAMFVFGCGVGGAAFLAAAAMSQVPGSNALFDADVVGGPDLLRRTVPNSLSAAVTQVNGWVSASIEGNFGPSTTEDSVSVSGKYSASQTATQTGGGSKSGSASYTVKTGRRFENTCYADPFSKVYAGTVGAVGAGSSNGDGLSNFFVTCTSAAAMDLNVAGGP